MKYNSPSIIKQVENNKVFDKKLLPEKQGVYFVCVIKKGVEVYEYIGGTKNLRLRLSSSYHIFNQLLSKRKRPYIRFAITSNFKDIERDMIYFHKPKHNKNGHSWNYFMSLSLNPLRHYDAINHILDYTGLTVKDIRKKQNQ